VKISSTNLQFSTQHSAASQRKLSETLRVWAVTPQPITSPASPQPVISSAAVSAQTLDSQGTSTQTVQGAADAVNNDPRMILIRLMVEMLTGHRIKIIPAPDQPAAAASTPAIPSVPPQAASSQNASLPAGVGIQYDTHTVQSESEQTSFQASGTVVTSDGQTIQFQLSLDMQRSFSSESSTHLSVGEPVKTDPLVINFNGTAAQLQSQRFSFDLAGNGQQQNVPLLGGGSGYLALDLNGNGKIDSGKELFGTASGNGFADLAKLDSDGNGWIDENDAAFKQLRVWTTNASGGGQLATLQEKNVGALYLGNQATPFELRDSANRSLGAVRSSGVYLAEDGSVGTLQQIDLSV
jgi:hypothetical protein